MRKLFKGGLAYINDEIIKQDILIENEKVINIAGEIDEPDCLVIDCKDKLISPGFIDLHVHLREPGYEYKETIKTGSMAAAAGGYTTILAMPNTNPVIDNIEILNHLKTKIKEDAVVRVLPYSAITKGEQGNEIVDIEVMAKAGVAAFSDDGVGVQDIEVMKEAMKRCEDINYSIIAHCEDNTLTQNGYIHDGEYAKINNHKGIPSISESAQIARDLSLAKEIKVHYHVCHISAKESVELVRQGKLNGINVTTEVCPHHLLLTDNDIVSDDGNYKMNPPLRGEVDKAALIKAINDGTIDCIVTDHAPHSSEEKSKGLKSSPFGIVGLETTFALLYTNLVLNNRISLLKLLELMTKNPGKIFKLNSGEIKVGAIADLTIIDLSKEKVINSNKFFSKGKNTPFDGYKCKGWPVATFVGGKEVFNSEEKNNE